ncbi:hypothetical protein TNCV_2820991 [Trichonephila clavipes]|nr:hypothetical protein TNCV_2820991 [Trichonephila clavipes]
MGGHRSLRYNLNFAFALFTGNRDYYKNVGASRFNALYGRQGCILTWTVEFNQGGRFDGKEFVADSFRSGAVSFKSTGTPFLEAFFPYFIFPESTNPSQREPLAPGSPPSQSSLHSDKYRSL